MATKHIHFPRTTADQRILLFEIWEATQDVTASCRRAHVGGGTFYYWQPRFEIGGYAALEQVRSHDPKEPARTVTAEPKDDEEEHGEQHEYRADVDDAMRDLFERDDDHTPSVMTIVPAIISGIAILCSAPLQSSQRPTMIVVTVDQTLHTSL